MLEYNTKSITLSLESKVVELTPGCFITTPKRSHQPELAKVSYVILKSPTIMTGNLISFIK